ncbi:MAG: glycosyltransferase [Methylovirgula sp.]
MMISPHGMLDPWITARGRWKKTLARLGYERRSWRDARLFHALTDSEAADIARETSAARHPTIAVVPNYVATDTSLITPRSNLVLYIGRIHPKKNLEPLVDGWLAAEAAAAGYRLAIAGWGDPAHVAALQVKLAASADPSISFLGPVYGEQKHNLLHEARFVILPSLSEGLPMAILEAWAAATPALMSASCNLPEGFSAGAAFDTGITADCIAVALRQALALPEPDWQRMSAAGAIAGADPVLGPSRSQRNGSRSIAASRRRYKGEPWLFSRRAKQSRWKAGQASASAIVFIAHCGR